MAPDPGVPDVQLVIVRDAEEAAAEVARRLARAAADGCAIALAGGATPRRAYERAAALERDWSGADLWFGDERCVPPDDPRANARMVREALIDRLARPPRAVHRIEGERGADAAAAAYDEALRGARLDLALLGVGADGHTASLFPNAATLHDARLAAPAYGAGVARVTLTPRALGGARSVLFLAVGAAKAAACARAFAALPSDDTPASRVRGAESTVAVLDAAAASCIALHAV